MTEGQIEYEKLAAQAGEQAQRESEHKLDNYILAKHYVEILITRVTVVKGGLEYTRPYSRKAEAATTRRKTDLKIARIALLSIRNTMKDDMEDNDSEDYAKILAAHVTEVMKWSLHLGIEMPPAPGIRG